MPIMRVSGHFVLSAVARSEPYNSPELSPLTIMTVFITVGIF